MGVTPLSRGRRRRGGKFGLFIWTLLLAAAVPAAHADYNRLDLERRERSVSLYHGHGVDEDLLELPRALLNGSVEWDESYFTGIGYLHGTRTPRLLEGLLSRMFLSGASTGVELVAVKHRGLQDNVEADLAYAIHTPYAAFGPLRLRFGFSVGLSYAFGTPSYEDGPKDDPEKRYRFQNYNAYELEWGWRRFPRVSLVTRVHHRSGIYGVIAPRRVGSNYLVAGLKIRW